MGEWTDVVKPIVGKLKVGSQFGQTVFDANGSKALAKLLADMAARIDPIRAEIQTDLDKANK